MYQEQQYYVPYPNPNPGDNPPQPGIDSFTYQQHGVGNFGAMTAMGSAYMHPAPPMMSNVTVTTMQPGISIPVQFEDCKKFVQKQAVTSVTAQNMSLVTPARAPSIVKLEDKRHRIFQNETAFQTHDASQKHFAKEIMQQAGTGGVGQLITPKSEDVPTSEPVSTPKVVEPVSSPKVVEPVSTPKVVEVLPDSLKKDDNIGVSHEVKPTCEICGISCNTNAMLNIHLEGKKHLKNMKLLEKAHQVKPTCEICGISFHTNAMLDAHLSGLKHKKNLKKHEVKPTCEICGISFHTNAILDAHLNGLKHDKNLKKHEVKPTCEICGISCDTNVMLEAHLSGRKHRKNLKRMEKPSVLPTAEDGGEIATPRVVDQLQDSLKDDKIVNEGGSIRKRARSELDVETKKQKIPQGGTAHTSSSICTVCNVVCLSP